MESAARLTTCGFSVFTRWRYLAHDDDHGRLLMDETVHRRKPDGGLVCRYAPWLDDEWQSFKACRFSVWFTMKMIEVIGLLHWEFIAEKLTNMLSVFCGKYDPRAIWKAVTFLLVNWFEHALVRFREFVYLCTTFLLILFIYLVYIN